MSLAVLSTAAPAAGPWVQVKSRSSPGVEQACGKASAVLSSFCLTIMSDLREHSHWRHSQDPLTVDNLCLSGKIPEILSKCPCPSSTFIP